MVGLELLIDTFQGPILGASVSFDHHLIMHPNPSPEGMARDAHTYGTLAFCHWPNKYDDALNVITNHDQEFQALRGHSELTL